MCMLLGQEVKVVRRRSVFVDALLLIPENYFFAL